jgi:hypothetical protein
VNETPPQQPSPRSAALRALAGSWLVVLASLFLIGPAAGMLTARLHGPGGGTDATLLITLDPASGLLAGVGVCLLACFACWLATRMGSGNLGVLSAGIVVSWAAARTGRIDEIVAVGRVSPMPMLIIEGLLVALLALVVAEAIRRFWPERLSEPTLGAAARALGGGLVGAGLTAWFVAVEPSKGQTIAAAAAAGVMGTSIARMILLSVPARMLVVIPAALAVFGPLATELIAGDVVAETFSGSLVRFGWILPLDWLGGALMGIPVGLAWTDSVVTQQSERLAATPPAADRGEMPTVSRDGSPP